MSRQLFVGFVAEGATDYRFLPSIIERTFAEAALEYCEQEIVIYVSEIKNVSKHGSFSDFAINVCKEALHSYGSMAVVIHSDSDKCSYQERYDNKFAPVIQLISKYSDDECCQLITPLIPVRMIESWMLADTNLFKEQLGTKMSDAELHINANPEQLSNPKQTIIDAIKATSCERPKSLGELAIGDLYGIIGEKIELDCLKRLESYRLFYESVHQVLCALKYCHI